MIKKRVITEAMMENEETTWQYVYEVVNIYKANNKIQADLMTETKSYKTAVKRLFSQLKDIKQFEGWEETILENCINGCFRDAETYTINNKSGCYLGGWHFEVESILDGAGYYITCNVVENNEEYEKKIAKIAKYFE